MMNEQEKRYRVLSLGLELTRIRDVDILLEHILSIARAFVNADAGSIYIREGDILKFSYTQNDTLQSQLPEGQKLIYSTFSIPINNLSIAGYAANTGSILNIPNVYDLPDGSPYTFNHLYDELTGYRTQSVLTVPLKNNRNDIIGILQLINSRDQNECIIPFSHKDLPFIEHFAGYASITLERTIMTRAMILRMIKMAELRDPMETGAHVNRVASYSVEIYEQWARAKEIPETEIARNRDVLRMAAMLHDVGKIAVPDTILKKPGKLNNEEYAVLKNHTWLGARLFSDPLSDFDQAAAEVALNHHEHWDGNGYPGKIDPLNTGFTLFKEYESKGKKGEEIPLFGRIVAIADVYDALSTQRTYKPAWDESRVLDTLRQNSAKQFDPELIAAFFRAYTTIRSIAKRYPDS